MYQAPALGLFAPPVALPQTDALRRVLAATADHALTADLLFLEQWELDPMPGTAAALRVGQIRRANPELAKQIRNEIETLRRPTVSLRRN